MKINGLLIAVVVLVTLTGTLYWSEHHKSTESSAQASVDTPPKILTLNESDITKIDLKKNAEDVVLTRNNSGSWELTAPTTLRADQSVASSMVSALSSLSADRLIEPNATDLQQYGLTKPGVEVAITEKNNKSQKLLFGDNTPTNSAIYAKLEDDPRVFTVASYTKNNIDKSVNELRDKRLLPLDSDKLTRLELITKKQDIEFGRSKDEWQIVKPKPLRADAMRVEDLVRALQNATMDLSSSGEDSKKAAAAFSSATPLATAKVTDASGTQQLEVRKKKDDYYAKSSAVDGVYKVTSQLGQDLDKSLDDFRNKKLFDFGFTDPQKIEMHDGSKNYVLSRTGQDWSSDGKKTDSASVNSLIDKLRDLSASKFTDSGFSSTVLDATVTSNDGKRVEKVLIAKNGNEYIAKRENEPGLYEIDASAFNDLQKAAADLKPAVQAPTAK